MELKENEVKIGEKVVQIKGVKLRYIKLGWYDSYKNLKEHGLVKLLAYADGIEVLSVFLQGILDIPKIEDELILNIDEKIIKQMLEITKNINELEDEVDSKNE